MTQIKFENRFENMYPDQKIFVSLDGVDFPINETYPFDKNCILINSMDRASDMMLGYVLEQGILFTGVVVTKQENMTT